jgi:hypothetical protein
MNSPFEEQSVKFLHDHMDGSFQHIMDERIISRIEWLDNIDCEYRPIAVMEEYEEDFGSNLICLFPPFIPKEE